MKPAEALHLGGLDDQSPPGEHPVRDLADYGRTFGVDFIAGSASDGEVA